MRPYRPHPTLALAGAPQCKCRCMPADSRLCTRAGGCRAVLQLGATWSHFRLVSSHSARAQTANTPNLASTCLDTHACTYTCMAQCTTHGNTSRQAMTASGLSPPINHSCPRRFHRCRAAHWLPRRSTMYTTHGGQSVYSRSSSGIDSSELDSSEKFGSRAALAAAPTLAQRTRLAAPRGVEQRNGRALDATSHALNSRSQEAYRHHGARRAVADRLQRPGVARPSGYADPRVAGWVR